MTTARDIAMAALAEQERPERERREAEEEVRKAAAEKRERAWKRGNAKLLRESPLGAWFPGVEWLLDNQESYGKPYMQTPTGRGVAFVDQPYTGQNGSEVIRVIISEGHSVYVQPTSSEPLIEVHSAAEVGRVHRDRWQTYYDSMPDHMP